MILGVIRTRDILMHPWIIISMRGIRGFFKLLFKALSRKPHYFINQIEDSRWVFVGKK
jgi:hypothetical protein